MKRCNECKQTKSLTDFNKDKTAKDGVQNKCKLCRIKFDYEYYQQNKERIHNRGKEYYQQNKERYNENRKKYYEKHLQNDPLYKLKLNIKGLIYDSFKRMGSKKQSRTQEILGCTIEEFKHHIESQFQPWMAWGNYGGRRVTESNISWDIDHITPISSAQTYDDIIRLNHYTNLRPLCSYYNRFVKRDKN